MLPHRSHWQRPGWVTARVTIEELELEPQAASRGQASSHGYSHGHGPRRRAGQPPGVTVTVRRYCTQAGRLLKPAMPGRQVGTITCHRTETPGRCDPRRAITRRGGARSEAGLLPPRPPASGPCGLGRSPEVLARVHGCVKILNLRVRLRESEDAGPSDMAGEEQPKQCMTAASEIQAASAMSPHVARRPAGPASLRYHEVWVISGRCLRTSQT